MDRYTKKMALRSMSREIDSQAAAWAVKLDAGRLTPEEEAALEGWLAQDARHLGAFGKARGIALFSARARALGKNFDAGNFGTVKPSLPTRRRVLLASGIAAGLAGIAAGTGIIIRLAGENTYTTRLGETRVIMLEDGSVITLNTNTQARVRYTKEQRTIDLDRGEALFDVAKNKARPFIVQAGSTLVRAVGTSFTVKRLPDEPVQVLVREGIVEIKQPNVAAAVSLRAAANTRAIAPENAPIAATAVPVAEVNRELVWRVGRLAFEGETLGEAATTFARYSDTKIVIDDSGVSNHRITGLFVSNDPVGFSKAIAIALNLHVETRDGEIHLTR